MIKFLLLLVFTASLLYLFVPTVHTMLRERARRKEREQRRKEAFDRSKELLQFLLVDEELAKRVRDGLDEALGSTKPRPTMMRFDKPAGQSYLEEVEAEEELVRSLNERRR